MSWQSDEDYKGVCKQKTCQSSFYFPSFTEIGAAENTVSYLAVQKGLRCHSHKRKKMKWVSIVLIVIIAVQAHNGMLGFLVLQI